MRAEPLLLIILVAAPALAHAQSDPPVFPQPLVRADLTGSLGWSNIREGGADVYDNWYQAVYAGAAFGWYWTDHLKTELDAGAAAQDEVYRTAPVVINGQSTYENARVRLARRSVAIGQHYQFFRNAWFHPFVSGGIELEWDERREEIQPVVIFGGNRSGEVARPAQTRGPETTFHVRPFVGSGFKAYVTQRAFFRSDARLSFGNGSVDEVLWRFGFGVDF